MEADISPGDKNVEESIAKVENIRKLIQKSIGQFRVFNLP
jgi:hypothetical protein